MNAITAFAKAHVALIGAVGTWLVAALKDGHVTGQEWYGLLLAVATGLGVALIPNKTTPKKKVRDAGLALIEVLVIVLLVLVVLILLGYGVGH